MARLLHLDASPRGERSCSRQLSHNFVEHYCAAHPGTEITYRDLRASPVPLVDEQWIAAAFSPPEACPASLQAALSTSDLLIDEFLAADVYVFGVPMYNLSIPAAFKSYIDQIVRVGRTFVFGPYGPEGLVHNKQMFVITARGSDYSSQPMTALDFQEPYLRTIFGMIGITDITFIHGNGLNDQSEQRGELLELTRRRIHETVARLDLPVAA